MSIFTSIKQEQRHITKWILFELLKLKKFKSKTCYKMNEKILFTWREFTTDHAL